MFAWNGSGYLKLKLANLFLASNIHISIYELNICVMGCGNLTKKSVIRSIHVLHKMKGRNWVQILRIYLKRKRFHVVFMAENVTQGMLCV